MRGLSGIPADARRAPVTYWSVVSCRVDLAALRLRCVALQSQERWSLTGGCPHLLIDSRCYLDVISNARGRSASSCPQEILHSPRRVRVRDVTVYTKQDSDCMVEECLLNQQRGEAADE